MGKTLAVDIDSVLYDFDAAFREAVMQYTGRPAEDFTTPQTWNFHEQWGLTAGEFEKFFAQFQADGRFRDGTPIQGAQETLTRLADKYTVVLVTARGFERSSHIPKENTALVRQDTAHWLNAHQIPHHGLVFAQDKTVVRADILIDDGPQHLHPARAVGVRAIAFTWPWNRDWDGERYSTWNEVGGAL